MTQSIVDEFDPAPAPAPTVDSEKREVWLHPREDDRLESLRSYGVVDSPAQPGLDNVARLAAVLCETPAAVVSLVEREYQWCAAAYGHVGSAVRTPRSNSICSDAVATESNLIIEDLAAHPRYTDLASAPQKPNMRAYAGVPLIGRDGLPLGTLSVFDWHPRPFTDVQIERLEMMAEQVVARLELQRADRTSGRSGDLVLGDALDARRLRRAIECGEFTIHFQPIVDIRSEAVVAIEALVRWNHPELGMVPPALFLPAMERTGLMIPLGRYVLDTVLRVAAELTHIMGISPMPTFNVNISSSELRSSGLALAIDAALQKYSVDPQILCIEVTETVPLSGDSAIRELEAIRALGVGIAIDDFGSGTATLGQVEALPATSIKIDRQLVLGAARSPRGLQIFRSACFLARDLQLEYCVEGIETASERDLVLQEGVEYGQGWFFASPLDEQHLLAFLSAKKTTRRTSTH